MVETRLYHNRSCNHTTPGSRYLEGAFKQQLFSAPHLVKILHLILLSGIKIFIQNLRVTTAQVK